MTLRLERFGATMNRVRRGGVFIMLLACSSNEPSDDGGTDAPVDAPIEDAAQDVDATIKDASIDVDATVTDANGDASSDATVTDANGDASSDATLNDSTVSDTSTNDVTITDASIYDGPCNDAAVDGSSVQLAKLQFSLSIAIDGTYVYWGGQSLRRCAIGGCGGNPTTLVTLPVNQAAGAVAVDTNNVYATVSDFTPDASSYVMSCATNGCDGGVVLAAGQQQMFAIAIDTNNVYWTDYAAGNVMSCAKTGCNGTPTTIASGQNGPWGIAVDGTTVYWGNTGHNGDGGAGLMSCPTSGCDGGAPQVYGSYPTIAVATRNGQVFFTIGTGVGGYVLKIGSDGGVVHLSGLEQQPDNLAVDDTNVYWTNDINYGYVRECNVNGCCQTPRNIAEDNTPRGIAVDPTHIFWANLGDIIQFTPQ